jgi:hypothetical protein
MKKGCCLFFAKSKVLHSKQLREQKKIDKASNLNLKIARYITHDKLCFMYPDFDYGV